MDLNSMIIIGVPLALLGIIGIYFAIIYNRLYRYRNASDANLSQIWVALKKRLDMIEQLLGATKGYVKHERELFESIASLRASLMKAGTHNMDEVNRESHRITGDILAIAEGYPELKANETVIKLMDAIVSVEDEIARHRYTYNNVVQTFNTMVDTIPSNVVARSSGMEKLGYLEFEEEVEKRPDIAGISEVE